MSNDSDVQVPEGWRYRKVREFIKEHREKGSNGKDAKKITVKLYGKGVFAKEEKRLGSTATQYYKRKNGQFIYSKLDFLNGAFGVIPKQLDGFESTLDLPCFDFSDKVIPKWFLEYVKRSDFYSQFAGLSDGGRKARRVNPSEFLDFEILSPPLSEQKKIASILTSVDDVIEKTEAQISKLQDLKKGMMTELLTKGIGHTEFKDSPVGRIPEGWDIVQLQDVLLEVRNGSTVDQNQGGETVPITRIETISDWKVNYSKVGYVAKTNAIERYALEKGDILLSHINSMSHIGKVALYGGEQPLYHGMNLLMLRYAPESVYYQYLYQTLSNENTNRALKLRAKQAINQASLNIQDIKSIQLFLPPLPEQKKIASILISIDSDVTAKQQKLNHTKSLKKALMNDLLTGKKRVTIDN